MPQHTDKVVQHLRENRQPLHKKCCQELDGTEHLCSRAMDGNVCDVYAFPEAKWRLGDCPMADSILKESVQTAPAKKKRVGQQKQKRNRLRSG
jgi:hypothetical protein